MKIDLQARMLAAQALQKPGPSTAADKQRKAQTAKDFEAIFVQQVFKEMKRTIPEGGLLPRSQAEEIYSDLQDMEAAKLLTGQGGVGLAEMLLKQMEKSR